MKVVEILNLKEVEWLSEETLDFDVWKIEVYDIGVLLLFWYELNI